MTGVCKECRRSKSIDLFYKDKNRKDGRRVVCKECVNEKVKDYYQRNKDLWRDRTRKAKYGIDNQVYATRLSQQGGVCAICREKETKRDPQKGTPVSLAVDHDHATGAFRGLLCSACNNGLGHFKDQPGLLRLAAEYLESNRGRQ